MSPFDRSCRGQCLTKVGAALTVLAFTFTAASLAAPVSAVAAEGGSPAKRNPGAFASAVATSASTTPQSVPAAPSDEPVPASNVRFLINGEPLHPAVTPVFRQNSLYLALTDLSVALGTTIHWDGADGAAIISVEGRSLELRPSARQARLNGEELQLGRTPFAQGEVLLVPLRIVAESLGFRVGWDPLNRIAFVLPLTPRVEELRNDPPIPLPNKNYGPFDGQGIPTKDYRGTLGVQYNPLVVSEYGQSYFGLYLSNSETRYRTAFFRMANWLVRNLEPLPGHDGVLVWYYKFDWPPYNNAPWISAITQGQGVDVLLHAFLLSGDPKYLEKARAAFAVFNVPDSAGGVRSSDSQGRIFLEEAPTVPPSRILNGFMSNLLTVYRYNAVVEDEGALWLFQTGVQSLLDLLPMYDVPDQQRSRYDLYDRVLFHLVSDKGGAAEPHPVSTILVQPPTDAAHRVEVGAHEAVTAPGNRLLAAPSTAWSSPRLEGGRLVRDFGPVDATYKHAAFYLMLSGNLLGGSTYSIGIEYRDVSRESVHLEVYSPVSKRYVRLGSFAGQGDGAWKWLYVKLTPETIEETGIGHLASQGYHHMHIGYLERLHELTGEKQFADYASRWRVYEVKAAASAEKP